MDVWQLQLQSTALPTELSRVVYCCRRQVHTKCHRELSQDDLEFRMANSQFSATTDCPGDVAQMVERSLSMWEVGGSIPPVSKSFCLFLVCNCWRWTTRLFSWFDQKQKTRTSWWVCKIDCIVRESNPGRPRGRRAFYHWTNDALLLIEGYSPKS